MTGYRRSPDYQTPVTRRGIILAVLAIAAMMAATALAFALPACGGGKRIDCVVDGDTLWIRGEKIRLAGVDAPEIGHAACVKERSLGEAARAQMEKLTVGEATITREGLDDYRRTLARVRFGGIDIGEAMITGGLARRWDGSKADWCR